MTHLMIDLETLSLGRKAVVTQIGWALFEAESQTGILQSGAIAMNVKQQMEAGREFSYSTFDWWMRQSETARLKLLNQVSTDYNSDILQEKFVEAFDWEHIDGVWGNGVLFDLVILQDLLEYHSKSVPWHYRAPRDFKTLRALRPNVTGPKPEIAHSAEHDAIAQAIQVQNIFHSLLNETGA